MATAKGAYIYIDFIPQLHEAFFCIRHSCYNEIQYRSSTLDQILQQNT